MRKKYHILFAVCGLLIWKVCVDAKSPPDVFGTVEFLLGHKSLKFDISSERDKNLLLSRIRDESIITKSIVPNCRPEDFGNDSFGFLVTIFEDGKAEAKKIWVCRQNVEVFQRGSRSMLTDTEGNVEQLLFSLGVEKGIFFRKETNANTDKK